MFPIYIGAGVVAAIILVVVLIAVNSGESSKSAEPRASDVARSGMSKGPEVAPVTLIEYGDFQCPACGNFATGVERQLESKYVANGTVRFEYRPYAFLGPESEWASEAAFCANDQGRFWEYHDMLYESQSGENRGRFSKANLKLFAKELGLDSAAFDSCLDSGTYGKAVKEVIAEAKDKGVRVTPTFFVNGKKVEGLPTSAQLDQLIQEALGKS